MQDMQYQCMASKPYAIIVICLAFERVARKAMPRGALFPRNPAWTCSCLTVMRCTSHAKQANYAPCLCCKA